MEPIRIKKFWISREILDFVDQHGRRSGFSLMPRPAGVEAIIVDIPLWSLENGEYQRGSVSEAMQIVEQLRAWLSEPKPTAGFSIDDGSVASLTSGLAQREADEHCEYMLQLRARIHPPLPG